MEFQTLLSNVNFSNFIWQILTPVVLSGVDIITGYIQAVINKNVDSSVMRKRITP